MAVEGKQNFIEFLAFRNEILIRTGNSLRIPVKKGCFHNYSHYPNGEISFSM
jgi:hypothetical protein